MTTYPPERHLLRDLRLSFENSARRHVARVVAGRARALRRRRRGARRRAGDARRRDRRRPRGDDRAAELDRDRRSHAAPDRRARPTATVEARAADRCARGARPSSLEVALRAAETSIGVATMSFSVLPRRDDNPDIGDASAAGPSTMALDGVGLDGAALRPRRHRRPSTPARGVVELPVRDWAKNSMGALQGGVVGAVVEAAAEAALRHAVGAPLVVTDLQLTYLSFGQVGPLRTGPRCSQHATIAASRASTCSTPVPSRVR